jgi:hypothetical protein
MRLTIDKYTKMVAQLDVRDLDLPNAFSPNASGSTSSADEPLGSSR